MNALSRRNFLKTAAIVGAGASLPQWGRGQSPAILKNRKPNILMISTDQWHADAFGYRGNNFLQTPHSDRIAAMGVDFPMSYSPDPVCGPTRTSWLTGLMPVEHAVTWNGVKIDPAIVDFGQWFGDHGYETAHFGKWHTSGRDPAKSFQYYTGMHPAGQYGDLPAGAVARSYLLSRTKDKPFIAHVSLMNPHDICQVACMRTADGQLPVDIDDLPPLPDNFYARPPEPEVVTMKVRNSPRRLPVSTWTETDWRFYRWMYYRYCEMVEVAIGQVLDALEASGQSENTVILYTSDHGEGLGHHGLSAKAFLYDEAARVPMVIAAPDRLPQGVIDDRTYTSGIDLFPTFCTLAGIPTPPNLCGYDIIGQHVSGKRARDILVTGASFEGAMGRDERYKLIRYTDRYVPSPTQQLFDMRSDPGETINLAEDPNYAAVMARLSEGIDDFQARLTPYRKS
ncbi:sulfatase-like hydrolase/transferase [Ruficoccus amylovorans]|uniref:Sulfatase-like hydrolase/transferase n=1 Tax=Ruficoccus amylovorans TaxID=1804625 RepID=A0A842H9I3_9BACT|nr:sulfatase-like hydrolase/transferase [Ruficoccus amylovorans]MBC2592925.1 sulfatase-like hydrolase/transferase [Ruficoccus amylovorans]